MSDLKVLSMPLSEADLDEAARIISMGEIIVTPTDTLYGIGAKATDPEAVARVLAAKGRGRQMPPPVVVAELAQLDGIVSDLPDWVQALAADFWPGALTLILPAAHEYVERLGDLPTLAVRVPQHDDLLALLTKTGPLALTSANLTGSSPALTCNQAVEYFADQVGLYLDGGELSGGTPSTIVNTIGDKPAVLRLGAVGVEELNLALAPFNLSINEGAR